MIGTKKTKTSKAYWISQVMLSLSYVAFLTFSYLDWNKHNPIVFPNEFQGDGGIVFGIEGYPEIPEMKTIGLGQLKYLQTEY